MKFVVAVIVMVLVLGACGSDDAEPTSLERAPVELDDAELSDDLEHDVAELFIDSDLGLDAFMEGCSPTNPNDRECLCMYDEMEEYYGREGLIDLFASGGEMSDAVMVEIALECL